MKKTNKLLFCLSITIVLMSCNNEKKQKKEIVHHAEAIVNSKRPSNAITYKEMASMFHEYDTGQKIVLDKYRENYTGDSNDAVETVSHFYEINQLKQYISYLERISKEKNIKLTGVRIFSAAYPEKHRDASKRGRQTLIFMPTAKIGNNNGVAFEPLYSEKGTPIKFTEFLNKFSSEETKKVMRASFLPALNLLQDDLKSSGTNRLEHTPPF
ncbi:hypothetical protein BXQ17_08940 [Polaribacter sp. BM10]|uniref:hypothetical protein n=1 Tax=Polaribacter sp. BM10 TaxID=1529069 RepID=UPI00098BA262|nr:hypothetical protein [Polaribacter sp. BM10]AQS94179.1 hypothetical protein BXQ17_08940 [Polaribacter sp. BM10]